MVSKVSSKTKEVDGYRLTFDSEWTSHLESREHWDVYWVQAYLVHELTAYEDRLLEIGVGTGFLSNYLRSRGWSVKTVDIDENKKPDIVSDASSFDFSGNRFSAVLAFEVFEHMPFPLFKKTIKNIALHEPDLFLFSLPRSVRKLASFRLQMAKAPVFETRFDWPKRKVLEKNHFWEIKAWGKADSRVLEGKLRGLVPMKEVMAVFNEQRYCVEAVRREGRIQFFKAYRNGR